LASSISLKHLYQTRYTTQLLKKSLIYSAGSFALTSSRRAKKIAVQAIALSGAPNFGRWFKRAL
jgi:hypothetical protein